MSSGFTLCIQLPVSGPSGFFFFSLSFYCTEYTLMMTTSVVYLVSPYQNANTDLAPIASYWLERGI